MASTIAIYTGDGTTTDFTVPFDYLAKKFVKVSVGLTVLNGGDYGDTSKDYYFLDKTTVRLKTAPQAGVEVTVRRYTSATDRIVSFKDASILKAKDLDTASIQTIHIAEEGRDIVNDALIVDKYGNWNAKGHRIVNVGDPVNDGDAVNFKTYKADAMGALQSRIEAEEARDRAKESEANAKESEANAKESEKVVTDIAEILVPMVPEVKIVADNIDHVVTDSNNINTINIVGTDLEGTLHDNIYDDYGDLGNPEAPMPVINGGNIKIVADNIEDVKTVVGIVPDFNKVINSVDTVTNLTVRAETAATESEASATQADASAKNSANSASSSTAQATASANSAKAAKLSEDNAALHKDSASSSAAMAKSYEAEAKEQADLAREYAAIASTGKLQSDWNQTDSAQRDYIKNKPNLGVYALEATVNAELLKKQPKGDYATTKALTDGLAGKANSSHTHTVADVTGLQDALNGKLNVATFEGFVDYGDLGNQ